MLPCEADQQKDGSHDCKYGAYDTEDSKEPDAPHCGRAATDG